MTDGKSHYLAVDTTALYGTSEAARQHLRGQRACTIQPVFIQACRQQATARPVMPQWTHTHSLMPPSPDQRCAAQLRQAYTLPLLQAFPVDTDRCQMSGVGMLQAQNGSELPARMMELCTVMLPALGQILTVNTAELASSEGHETGS